MKRTASVKKNSKSKGSSPRSAGRGNGRIGQRGVQFVVCVKRGGYVDLEPLKVYKVRRDAHAAAQRLIRVVDGSGEDYLYPAEFFRRIEAPRRLFEQVEM